MKKDLYGINKYYKRIVANHCPIVSPACILQAFKMLATEDAHIVSPAPILQAFKLLATENIPTAPVCTYDTSIESSNSYFTSSGAIITKIIKGDKIEYQLVWGNTSSINKIKLNRPYIGDKDFIFLCGGGGGGAGGSGGVYTTKIPGAGGGGGGNGTPEFISHTELLQTDIIYTIDVGLGGIGGLGGDGQDNSATSGTDGSYSSISINGRFIYAATFGSGGQVASILNSDFSSDFSSGGNGGNSSKFGELINGGAGGSVASQEGAHGEKFINCTGGGGGGASGNSSSQDGGNGGSGQDYAGGGGGGASYDSGSPGIGGSSTYGGQGGNGSNGTNDSGNGLDPSSDPKGFGQGGGGGGGGSILTSSGKGGDGGNGGNGSVAMLFTFTMVCLSSN
jgi:hypothetical protein